ncbi:ABC transporter substrate-binding protein [soil metagenome]
MRRTLATMAVLMTTIAVTMPALAQSDTATDEPVRLTVGMNYDLYTSNPLRACGCGAEYEFLALNYDMLLRFDEQTLSAAPGLATEVPTKENGGISADGMTYTFHIRDDATWHDGTPVTADDVAFTYRFVLDNKIGAYNNYLPYDPVFETPDDSTLVWKMTTPNLSPVAPAYIPILPEHVWAEVDGDPKAAKQLENIPAIGSGPFQLVEWEEGRFWRVETNDDYWDGPALVDEIVFRAFDNPETMALALRDGEVDLVAGLPPNIARSLEGQDDIEVHEAVGRGFLNLAFNFGGQDPDATNHPALDDLTVRTAIAHAIDKQALVDKVLLGNGAVGTGLMPPTSPWFWEPGEEQEQSFDLDSANSMLDSAGYLDTDDDGVREMPGGGESLELELVAASSVISAPASAKLIAGWLVEIGIGSEVKAVGDGAMNQVWTRGTFDAYLWGWNPDPDPDFILSVFTTDQCGNWSDGCYSDPVYDQLYTDQQQASSLEERQALVAEMQSFLYDDVAEVILFYESDLEAYRTDTFSGYSPTPPPDGYMVFGYLHYPYMNIEPVASTAGADSSSGSGAIPLWAWGGAAAAIVIVALLVSRARRSRADERI